jgi:hypothetical protein
MAGMQGNVQSGLQSEYASRPPAAEHDHMMGDSRTISHNNIGNDARIYQGNVTYHSGVIYNYGGSTEAHDMSPLLEQNEAQPQPFPSIPFRRDPDFIDREGILEEMKQCCSPAGRVALFGLGGVGKSQLAIEFAHRIAETSDMWVFWIHAGTQARIEEGFRTIAEIVKPAGRKQPKADIPFLVQNWLTNERNGRWVIVLDSADNRNALYNTDENQNQRPLATYLPESRNGSVIITTRSRDLAYKLTGSYKNMIQIGPMVQKDALALLEKKLVPHFDADAAEDLIQALDYIPLAIGQAAAYIQERAPRSSIKKYLAEFQKSEHKKVKLLEHDAGDLRRDRVASNTVLATWQISFDYISSYQPSAASLLSFMSLFDCQGIPEWVLNPFATHTATQDGSLHESENAGSEEDSDSDRSNILEDDILLLRNYCLITCNMDGDKFEMHRLVQLSMKNWLKTFGKETLEKLEHQYIERMAASFPTGEYENWATCGELFAHAQVALDYQPSDDKLKEWAMLCYNGGRYALLQGKYNTAMQMADKAHWALVKTLGQDDALTLQSKKLLASVYLVQGRWMEAEELQMQAKEASKMQLGPDHPDTLKIMSDLALACYFQGRREEAEMLQLQVMKDSEIQFGPSHPETLKSMAHLATTFHAQGRWKEAKKLRIQVMEMSKKELGSDHPDTLKSMGNLASSYHDQRRWKDAEKLEEYVMKAQIAELGSDHPDTLKTMSNLASTLFAQGSWERAKKLQLQVMEIRKIKFGSDHPDTLTTAANLALTLSNQHLWKEAEILQVQVEETRKAKLGPAHPDTLRATANLVATISRQNRWKEAEMLQVQVMEACKIELGLSHQDTLRAKANLALIYKNQGQHKRALALMKDCLLARQQVLGLEHPETQESMAIVKEWR